MQQTDLQIIIYLVTNLEIWFIPINFALITYLDFYFYAKRTFTRAFVGAGTG
jgi:hypothetical protein